eukprot:3615111-Amphidinium_carterae.2
MVRKNVTSKRKVLYDSALLTGGSCPEEYAQPKPKHNAKQRRSADSAAKVAAEGEKYRRAVSARDLRLQAL